MARLLVLLCVWLGSCGALWAQDVATPKEAKEALEFARISEAWRSLTASIDRQNPLVRQLTDEQAKQKESFAPSEARALLIEQLIREHELQLTLFRQMLQEERPITVTITPLPWQSAARANVEAATRASAKRKRPPARRTRRRR